MTEAIVLAAGYASRMQTNKMLLMINEKPIITRTVENVLPFVKHVFVVTGHYHESIAEIFNKTDKVTVIYNPNYALGMFNSIKAGVIKTSGNILIIPGDMPLINPQTYELILNQKGLIRVPTYQGVKGHPIYLDSALKAALIKSDLPHLKAFRDSHKVTYFPVSDAAILKDIDTPEDFHSINQ